MPTVISVENLSKTYRLGEISTGTFFRDFERWFARVRGKPDPYAKIGQVDQGNREGEDLMALRDVSFTVAQGEVLGIIGRNGAGKSTLLKILSRVTAPSSGQIKVRGRIASLLEVGTGFHPELTGRENIYLNGAILGMTREEVRRKFDEIVDFAGVEKFIDTPVKRYSSGMYVRLAFAVAAHLEPEILIVDEVLAVGDAGFQKKCLGKMGEVAQGGRTVLFVSHQMDMVRALCTRCLLLRHGSIASQGTTETVIQSYINQLDAVTGVAEFSCPPDEHLPMQVLSGRILGREGQTHTLFDVFDPITIELTYVVRRPIMGGVVLFRLMRNDTVLFTSFDTDTNTQGLEIRQPGEYTTHITLPCPFLKPGVYTLSLGTGVANATLLQYQEQALAFEVELTSQPATFLSYAGHRPGVIAAALVWDTMVHPAMGQIVSR
ncbi:MAG: ABC transporter ATP-binding protein [Oscillochloridaceae bacterium umkhey_bin13]